MNTDIVNAETITGLQRRNSGEDRQELPLAIRTPEPQTAAMTPGQAKIDAVASLTLSAYQRASQLSMSDEEIAALTADFPDEAFKPGAAGKENLIYIEHAFLRERLNAVFRPGQWAIVPRNRWAEDFSTRKGDSASRVYVEAMLCIRGCFAAEAVGEMEYYPTNAAQNYGDAVEGAKTAALRRCCKELGIGLQAWKKDWCDGWWARRRNGSKPSGGIPTPSATKNAPTVPTRPKEPPITPLHEDKISVGQFPIQPKLATEATKAWMFDQLKSYGTDVLLEYATKNGILLPTETDILDWPLSKVPTSQDALRALMLKIETFSNGGEPPMSAPASAGTRNADDQQDDIPYDSDEWRKFPMPFGKHAGVKLEDLDKKYLYGLAMNFTVEKTYQGKPRSDEQIQKDRQLRAYLDDASKHYQFVQKD